MFPLGIRHGLCVVFQVANETGPLHDNRPQRDVVPSFHISQIDHDAFHWINDPGHSKTDGLSIRVYLFQTENFLNKSIDQRSGISVLPGHDDLASCDDAAIDNDARLGARGAHVKADRCGGAHDLKFLSAIMRNPSRVRSKSTICNSGSLAEIRSA